MAAESAVHGRHGGADALYRVPALREADFTTRDPAARQSLEDRMNLYFGQPLDMFPGTEGEDNPGWFHRFYGKTIGERFPDDEDLRDAISRYRRWFTRRLWTYVVIKRALAGSLMLWIGVAVFIPPWGSLIQSRPAWSVAAPILWLGLGAALYWLSCFVALRYYYDLELDKHSSGLRDVIVQRTRDLQSVYKTITPKIDRDETEYGDDGKAWGEESARLIRLMMWIAKRMEYVEKFIQVEMWRVRRQRLFAEYVGAGLSIALALMAIAIMFASPTPIALRGPALANIPIGSVGIKLIVAGFFLFISAISFFSWQTAPDLVRQQLNPEIWVRFGNLDLDNTIGEQVKKDKERLVEYRTVNRALSGPGPRH